MTSAPVTSRPAAAETGDVAVRGADSRRTSRRAGTALSFAARFRRDRVMLLMVLPGFLYFVVFHWLPIPGNIIAFEDYQPYLGFIDSVWVGLDNFAQAFADPAFWYALRNTLVITLMQLVLFFPVPIMLALLLNSIMSPGLKRFVQSVIYLPHFLGWVIIISIFTQMLGPTGAIPNMLEAVGLPGISPMTNPDTFPLLVTLQTIWKDAGWGTIMFLAALASIDDELYEAAAVDGAGPWRRTWAITIPGIMPIVILLLILNLGTALSVGFEQIVLQRNNVGAEAGEVLDTYVYYHGIVDGQWGTAAAVGLVKGVVGLFLVLGANKVAHMFGQDGVYSRDR
ncbi:ABC transporter permease [Microbacterium hydrocarbonoxydans]|uniref:ABC transporter permease n=1 Tax=Microbacterium hydrocarbonoxydans TaxID=273678 RepID=UPI001FBA3D33|nr:ABC transporter permease subunit [Microbacterium hydrocarbonoxydans]